MIKDRDLLPVQGQMAFAASSSQAIAASLKPFRRPDSVVLKAMAQRQKRIKGAVCGDPDLQGEAIGTVPGRIFGCGIKSAVRVKSIAGIDLSQKAVMDCTTAQAFKSWIRNGLKPAIGDAGGGVAEIQIAAHYACRTRNNQRGAKISEHGKGRAIDITGVRLHDGRNISVLEGWRRKGTAAILKRIHRSACGIFGTVLGPDANRFHRDHFHFDTARYRSGSYCR
ncbi:extensin family protein [Marivita sp. GX14005]|uniref:extensin-like domain-containing protein n=1 Tax=Marivita sp. GX14005 TaxID=2942276 RepID=UPI0032D57CC9